MRKYGLLYETVHILSFPRLEAYLYDDYNSYLPLEPNSTIDTPLTNLEEVIDPPLTSLPFVAPSFSSMPRDITIHDLTLLASPLALA